MFRKIVLIISVAYLFTILSGASAGDYVIKNYSFIWHVSKAGKVNLKIQKDPIGLKVLLSSPGGKLATLVLIPAQAKEIGAILLKAKDYYDTHQKFYSEQKQKKSISYNNEHYDKILIGNFQVIFHSSPKGKEFDINVSKSEMFSPAVLLTKEEALEIGKYLVDAEKLAAIVKQRVKL